MWAEKNRIHAPARLRQRLVHFVVDGIQRRHIKQPAPDARLIAGDNHVKARLIQPRNRIQTAGNRSPLLRAFDVGRAVVVDHAVAIENDQLHAASLERLTTWLVRLATSCSKAKRFVRKAGSSALTITLSKNCVTG